MSQRRQTASKVIDAYNEWSMPAIMAFREPDCVQEILPKSLGRPTLDNQAYEAYFAPMMPLFQNFHVEIKDVFEDEKENKVVIWAISTANSVVGPYSNEYMLGLYFNEAGDKVVRFLEYVDSANSLEFFPRLRKWVEEKAAQSAA